MIKGVYYRMIKNLQIYGGYQDLQYIHDLLMYPDFVLMDNLMPQIMGKLSQIIKLSNGDPDTPTLTETMTGPYKDYFMQAMTHYIKELEQHGTWTIVSRK